MSIEKICILGLEDFAMLKGDVGYGHVGGESVQHVLLARAWRDLGLDVSIVVLDHGQPHVSAFDGIRAVSAYAPDAGVRGLRFFHPRLTSVCNAMRETAADVYYQSPAAVWSGVTTWFAARTGKRSILRIASDSDCIRNYRSQRRKADRWIYERGLRKASLVAAQTEQQRVLLRENFGVESELVNIAAEPASTAAVAKDIDVLWVGNFRRVKRPDLFVELARRVPHRKFVFLGGSVPGGEGYYAEISRAARELSNVEFVGPVSYSDTAHWFDRARLHVNTSDHEGFPNTFLQAWVRGVPVVSFFDPDAVIQRRNLGCAVGGMEDMAKCIERLLTDPDACKGIGQRARDFTANEFFPRQIAQRYLDLLERRSAYRLGSRRAGSEAGESAVSECQS